MHIECAVSLAKYEKNNHGLETTVVKRPSRIIEKELSPLILPKFNHVADG
jgi:hypothetical protein